MATTKRLRKLSRVKHGGKLYQLLQQDGDICLLRRIRDGKDDSLYRPYRKEAPRAEVRKA